MNKLFFVLILLIIFSSFVSSSIINYTVPSSVPLGKILTVDGQISPAEEGVQCSFRIYDDQNILVKRLTDEFTSSNGVFSSTYLTITEPTFYRDSDYNVFTDCAGSVSSSIFTVAQKEAFDFTVQQEFLFVTSQENTDVYFIMGVLIFVIILILLAFIHSRKVIQ